MGDLELSVGLVNDCDRTAAIVRGDVVVQGVNPLMTTTNPGDLFRRVVQFAEFDIAEMSVATFVALSSRGDDRYRGLPIFPRRAFRHGFIFVNSSSGIEKPRDLESRRVGVSEYQQTASLWIRGILRDEYGVDTTAIEWHEGGLDEPEHAERLPLRLPERTHLQRLPEGTNLSDMLRDGKLDAVIGPRRPRCMREGDPRITRLIPDYRTAEQDYFRRTGFFPIMHMVVVRSAVLDQHPWVATNVCTAFDEAKRASDRDWRAMADRSCGLPWLLNDVEELQEVFGGEDHWPYGLRSNRATLQKIIDMAFEDGLVSTSIPVDELFALQVRGDVALEFT